MTSSWLYNQHGLHRSRDAEIRYNPAQAWRRSLQALQSVYLLLMAGRRLNVSSIAIVGAGPSGIAAAK